jgi:hypothetical protein
LKLMRAIFLTALALVVCTDTVVQAGVPDPERSGCALEGQAVSCQFRFRLDGSLDALTLCVTLRDIFDVPIANCSMSATLNNPVTLCTNCCTNPQMGQTNWAGVVYFVWNKLGGRGSAQVCVTSHCVGDIGICCQSFDFTSTDLDHDCLDTDVIDLGIWAGCLPPGPYCEASDYNCDGTINVIDLGLWAGGLGVNCASGPPCP